MAHTTRLTGDWIAIHNASVDDADDVLFRRIDGADVVIEEMSIPYAVMKEFIASQVRDSRISALESSTADMILGIVDVS